VLAVLPAFAFVIYFFLWPVSLFLVRGATNEPVTPTLQRTMTVLEAGIPAGAPDDALLRAFFTDLKAASPTDAGVLARILSEGDARLRSAVMRAANASRQAQTEPADLKAFFGGQNPLWLEPRTWSEIGSRRAVVTTKYLETTAPWPRANAGGQDIYALQLGPIYVRTLLIALQVSLTTLLLALPVAWMMANASPRVATLVTLAVLVPFWSSILVRTLSWIVIFQKEGVLNQMLQSLGLINDPLSLLKTRTAVIIGMVHVLLPYMILPLYDGLKKIPKAQFQAALSLGATPLRAMMRVYLPQLRPAILAGVTIVFTLTIGFYLTPLLLGGSQDQLIGYYAAFYAQKIGNWRLAGAVSLWLIVLTIGSVLLLTALSGLRLRRLRAKVPT
jgi:putative spermidine/putrescine transport system permease protein